MNRSHRREFLANVGRGMLLASVGPVVAQDLGLASAALADDSASRLTFGQIEPLVALMQDTPVDRLLPAVVERIKAGEDFARLVTAAAVECPDVRRQRLRGLSHPDGTRAGIRDVASFQTRRRLCRS